VQPKLNHAIAGKTAPRSPAKRSAGSDPRGTGRNS
jgi:hypothetical protein